MSKIKQTLDRIRGAGKTALIPYITAGDPSPAHTVDLMHALVAGGADIIELGVPFSDPMADGPTIQRATERALAHGVGLREVLAMVQEFRTRNATTPVVLMGYANPIEAMGQAAFAVAARTAGVDGVLTVDYPPEECQDFVALLRAQSLDPIFLLAPTSKDSRIDLACASSSGFMYYVSLKGVTGATHLNWEEARSQVARIRGKTDLPVGIGFGIRDEAAAREAARVADAVIIGSRLVAEIEQAGETDVVERIRALTATFRHAIDTADASAT